jgi:hypothetical protein
VPVSGSEEIGLHIPPLEVRLIPRRSPVVEPRPQV